MHQPRYLGGSNLLLIIQRVPGNRAQVGIGRTTILTTTSSNLLRRSAAATREDVCPSLLVASMTSTWATIRRPWVTMSSRWNTHASTSGSPPLKRTSMRFRTLCTNIPSGKKKHDNVLPPSSNTRSRRTKIGSTYSRVSTSTRPSENRSNNQLGGVAPITSGKFSFLYFIIFFS